MNPINKKSQEPTKNVFYGVDINDKQAVQKEYERLQKQHRRITILVILVLGILGVIAFDFVRVNYMEGKPIFASSEKVDGGTLFNGLGYKVLYCENGERYIGSVLYKTCSDIDMATFSGVLYNKMMEYAKEEKIVDKDNLVHFTINELEKDEDNEEGGNDYILDVTYACKDGSGKCFRIGKEYTGTEHNKMYVRVNMFNEVYSIIPFKDSGVYFERLNEQYTEKVKTYLIENQLLTEDNVKIFKVQLTSNNGRYKFRGNVYADSYLININYSCLDNSNVCVRAFDKKDIDGDFANLSFYASMLLDAEDNVALVGPREYLEIE